MSSVQKHWISAQELLEDALQLATLVRESGFRPDAIIGLWRGGAPVAVAVHEALRFHGMDAAHMPVVTRLYSGIDRRAGELLIEGLERLQPILAMPARILLVDDVWDTGITLTGVRDAIAALPGAARELRSATVWFKPGRNLTRSTPDYRVRESDDWLVFPHELEGLDIAELREHRGEDFVRALLGKGSA
jgi:hypoxanthine phosphoribosyltransferase